MNAYKSVSVDAEKATAEAALDGLYVTRTSLPADAVNGDEGVHHYRGPSCVEAAFRLARAMT